MNWGHFLGFYLVLGSVMHGLGMLVKIHWVRIGKIPAPWRGRHGKSVFIIASVVAVLFWPVFLIGTALAWKLSRDGKVEEFLGHCEHATAFQPICEACGAKMKKEKPATIYLTGIRPSEDDTVYDKIVEKMRDKASAPRPIAPAGYVCCGCRKEFLGFPPHATRDRRALCEACRKEDPDA